MKEQVKTIVLLILVISSIVLTYLLWYGKRPLEEIREDFHDPVYFEEPRPLEQIVAPIRITLFRDGNYYVLGFGDAYYNTLWEVALDLLQTHAGTQQYSGVAAPAVEPAALSISFYPPLPVGQGTLYLRQETNRLLDSISFHQSEGMTWAELRVEGSEETAAMFVTDEKLLLLEEAIHAVPLDFYVPYQRLPEGPLSLSRGQILLQEEFMVPAGQLMISDLLLKKEQLDQDRVIKAFFVDRSLVRSISERDGSQIFTDGEKGLRLGDSLEFSQPLFSGDPLTMEYQAALAAAGRLLGYYGGWPQWLRLESLKISSKAGRYAESWSGMWLTYFEGLPVFGEETSLHFNDSGMVEYRRRLFEPVSLVGASQPIVSYEKVLEAAYAALREARGEETELPAVWELRLGYWISTSYTAPRAEPVWRVRIEDLCLVFSARDLSLYGGDMP